MEVLFIEKFPFMPLLPVIYLCLVWAALLGPVRVLEKAKAVKPFYWELLSMPQVVICLLFFKKYSKLDSFSPFF